MHFLLHGFNKVSTPFPLRHFTSLWVVRAFEKISLESQEKVMHSYSTLNHDTNAIWKNPSMVYLIILVYIESKGSTLYSWIRRSLLLPIIQRIPMKWIRSTTNEINLWDYLRPKTSQMRHNKLKDIWHEVIVSLFRQQVIATYEPLFMALFSPII